jgi:hypothetical protein
MIKALKAIGKHVNLLNPEAMKEYLAKVRMSEGRKRKCNYLPDVILSVPKPSIQEASL